MGVKKRFVAGAQCPQCQQLDTVVIFQEDDTQQRQCVECGFSERMDIHKPKDQSELPTRVNQAPMEKIKLIE